MLHLSLHSESFSTWCILLYLMNLNPSHQKLLGSDFPKQKHRDLQQDISSHPVFEDKRQIFFWNFSLVCRMCVISLPPILYQMHFWYIHHKDLNLNMNSCFTLDLFSARHVPFCLEYDKEKIQSNLLYSLFPVI